MKYIYTFLLIIFYQFAFAQSDTILPKGIIKFSPISYMDLFTPGIQFAYEKPLKRNRTLQFEIGYLDNFWDNNNWLVRDGFIGYRMKVEYREYMDMNPFGHGFYIGGMVKWKQTFNDVNQNWFSVYDNAYRQKFDYYRIASSGGIYFTFGQQWKFDEKYTFELGAALGLRAYYSDYYGLPEYVDMDNINGFFDFDLGFYVFPSIYPTVKFGYIIE